MDFDGLMQLQPHHLKMLIPNLDERISFQSLLFKAIIKERESLNANSENDVINAPINNSVQFDSTYTVELVEDNKVNESEIAASNYVFKIIPSEITINPTTNSDKSGQENIADKDDEVKRKKLDGIGKVEFLTSHTDSWPTICDYWKATSAERQVLSKEYSLDAYIKKFPCMQIANGYELIDIDFRLKYPETKISIEWNDFVSAALGYAKKVKDKTAKELIANLPIKTKSDEMVLALKLLPFLLPVQRGKKVAGAKTPSKLEVSQKFISHFKTEDDDERTSVDFVSMKVIGAENHVSYVRFGNDVEFSFRNIFDAFTYCFKMFYVYNLKFPEGTEQVWDFINVAFFNIETTKISPTCFTLLSDLKGLVP